MCVGVVCLIARWLHVFVREIKISDIYFMDVPIAEWQVLRGIQII